MELKVNGMSVPGRVNDTRGEFWQFDVDGLQPGRRYMFSLTSGGCCAPFDR